MKNNILLKNRQDTSESWGTVISFIPLSQGLWNMANRR